MIQVCSILSIPVPDHKTNFNIPCPVCDYSGSGKHLNINIQKNVFCCPKCSEKGGILDLYVLMTGLSRKEAFNEIQMRLTGNVTRSVKFAQYEHPPVIENPLTDIQTRDQTYKALLSRLKLTKQHHDNLLNRGLNDAQVEMFGYKSAPTFGTSILAKGLREDGYSLQGVPGFYRNDKGEWDFYTKRGILIPVRNMYGFIQGLQIRLDESSDRKYRWISSRDMTDGTASETWCHFVGDPAADCPIITEGPLKADIVSQYMGRTVIAVPGVNSLSHLRDVLQELRDRGVRTIYIGFDMDYISNPHVKSGREQLQAILEEYGFCYKTYIWNPYFKGLDDYVTRNKK